MTQNLTLEQIAYLKSLDSKEKRREFLLDCLAENVIGESEKIIFGNFDFLKDADFPRYLFPHEMEQIQRLNTSFTESKQEDGESVEFANGKIFEEYANDLLDKNISLETCQSLKTKSIQHSLYELASKFRNKEKEILDTFSREKLLELVQNGTIQISDMINSENRKTEKLFSKPEEKRIDPEKISDFPKINIEFQLVYSDKFQCYHPEIEKIISKIVDNYGGCIKVSGLPSTQVNEHVKVFHTNTTAPRTFEGLESFAEKNKWDKNPKLEDIIKSKLLIQGFKNEDLLNNRGLIGATIEETVIEVVKNYQFANENTEAKFTKEDIKNAYLTAIVDYLKADIPKNPFNSQESVEKYLKKIKNDKSAN